MNQFIKSVSTFIQEEEGSQAVEYALIIAVVSIAIVGVLGDTTDGMASKFSTLVGRISTCFTAGGTCT
jgi:pilus assembly protein Flp/PilA